jgi:hypothetical protein
MNPADGILFSGGAPGAEAAFGEAAERHGVEEVNFSFDQHRMARTRGIRMLNHEELQAGDVSLEYVSRLMKRTYTDAQTIRKILQTLWFQVNNGQKSTSSARCFPMARTRRHWLGRRVCCLQQAAARVDQNKDRWERWTAVSGAVRCLRRARHPAAFHRHGTRHLQANGRRAIDELFARSFS